MDNYVSIAKPQYIEDWHSVAPEHRWLLDKLLLSDALGYTCGPVGCDVPQPGRYIVRPITNLCGMGAGSRFEWIDCSTDHLSPGHFWCEIFKGRHISIDYTLGEPVMACEGFSSKSSTYLWDKWEKCDTGDLRPPEWILEVLSKYPYTNIEYINGKMIEIQFRHNSDFRWGNTVAYPKERAPEVVPEGYRWVECRDGWRGGFLID